MAKKTKKAAEVTIDINANVASLAKDMRKVTAELDGLGRKVTSMNKLLKAGFALELGKMLVPALKELLSVVGDLAKKGEEAGSIKEAFDKLGGNSAQIELAQKAVVGLVDSFDLMKIANEGLVKGIPGFNDNFSKIADVGARVADTLGIDTKAGIEQVIDALSTGKDKQLAAIGVTVNAEKAYANYAEQIGVTVKQLSDAQKLEAKQIAAIEGLDGALSKLGPVTDSVANAQEALWVQLEEVQKQVGVSLNGNEELAAAWRDVGKAIEEIDWEWVAEAMGKVATVVVEGFAWAIQYTKQFFNDFVVGLRVLDEAWLNMKAGNWASPLDTAIKSVASQVGNERILKGVQDIKDATNELAKAAIQAKTQVELARLEPAFNKVVEKYNELGGGMPDLAQRIDGVNELFRQQRQVLPETTKVVIQHGEKSAKALEAEAAAAGKASNAIDNYSKKWSDLKARNAQTGLQDAIKKSIDSLNYQTFKNLKEQLQRAIQEGFVQEWQGAIDSGAVSFDEIQAEGEKMAQAVGEDLEKEMTKAANDAAKSARDSFSEATSALTNGMKMAAEAFGVDLGSSFDVLISQFGDEMNGITQKLGEALGMSGSELAGWVNIIGGVAQAGFSAHSKDKATKSNKGTGEAVGAGLGMVVGGVVGTLVPVIGTMFGAALGAALGGMAGGAIGGMMKWGPQNKDTKARHVFANWLQDQLAQLDAVTLIDRNGKYRTVRGSNLDFIEGPTNRFNDGSWGDTMNSWGDAASTFAGLGNALKEVLGLTEEVGTQIGFLLGENLAGNIDNARLLVYELGLSFEDLSEALLKMAKRGEISWREYAVQVQGLGEAFKPGLQGVADLRGAWDEFIGSGGRGMAALKGIKDIAHEAVEGGIHDLGRLRDELVKKGVSPEEADAFIKALRENGIKSVDEVAKLSEAQLGAIVSSVEGASKSIADKWKEMGTDLEKIKWNMDQLPTEKDIKIKFSAEYDENMQKASDAGLLESGKTTIEAPSNPSKQTKSMRVSGSQTRTASMMAHHTPQAKTGSVSINIDARNAEVGVEERIASVMSTYRDAIVRDAATTVMDYQSRTA